jgi:hypothetical protein
MNFNEVVAEIVQSQPALLEPFAAASLSEKRFALHLSKAYHLLLPQMR